MLVRDTGIEPVTSSVSGKRSPAELIAPGQHLRWRRESNPCARLCRPLPHHSATPPLGLMPLHLRADDGIRTRDPHLGKVMRYQLRYIRTQRARSSSVAKRNDSPPGEAYTNPLLRRPPGASEQRVRLPRQRESVPVGIGAPHARRLAGAAHPAAGLELVVRQRRTALQGGVAGADEARRPVRSQRDALPVVGQAGTVGGAGRGSPVPFGDVAAQQVLGDDSADVAARRGEADEVGAGGRGGEQRCCRRAGEGRAAPNGSRHGGEATGETPGECRERKNR